MELFGHSEVFQQPVDLAVSHGETRCPRPRLLPRLFEFLRMPFGLKEAAHTFQRLMNLELQDLTFAFVCLNDIVVVSPSHEEHLSYLKQVFQCLEENHLIVNMAKCQFGLLVIDFLGHVFHHTAWFHCLLRCKQWQIFPAWALLRHCRNFWAW